MRQSAPKACTQDFMTPVHLSPRFACCQACEKYKIVPGVFCIGEARAAELAAKGFKYVAYDTDLGAMMNYTATVQAKLKPAAKSHDV